MEYQSFNTNYLEMLNQLSMDFETPPVISPDMIKNIQSGETPEDIEFDQIYPPRIRALSDIQWTSIKVARLISEMIGKDSKARFIDIGAGVGKLCILLSFLTDMEIFGIEQREDLHKITQAIIQNNHIEKVHMIHGNMLSLDWSEYDVFYLYNPFQEHVIDVFWAGGLIDQNIGLDKKYYAQYVESVFCQMAKLEVGKKVIILHGYGGIMPPSMKLLNSRRVSDGELCLWEKTAYEKT